MWPFSNSTPEWEACPDWKNRFDFVVKPTPDIEILSTSPIAHIGIVPYEPAKIVLRYYIVPFQSVSQRLRGALNGQRSRLFFTSFTYDDPELGECTVTREDLCTAFTKLVKNWHNFMRTYSEAAYVINRYPYKDDACLEDAPNPYEDYAAAVEEGDMCKVMSVNAMTRLFYAADYFGQYLDFLSDLEDSGTLPSAWMSYPGVIDTHTVQLKSTGRYRLRVCEGMIDDYAFRASRVLNDHAPCCLETVDEAVAKLRELTRKNLAFKGYTEEDMAELLHGQGTVSPILRRRHVLVGLSAAAELGWTARGCLDPVYTTQTTGSLPSPQAPTKLGAAQKEDCNQCPPPPYNSSEV